MQMADADGAVLSGVNLNEVIGMALYTTVSWDSSYPWAATQSTRGGSMASN